MTNAIAGTAGHEDIGVLSEPIEQGGGYPAEPIAMGGPANLLIRNGGLVDDGLRGVMARHGVAVGSLQIGAMADDVLTEAALLAVSEDEPNDDGAPLRRESADLHPGAS